MNITILYGTESGNAEMIANDLADTLSDHAVDVLDMSTFDPARLDPARFHLIICSTYGKGDLPSGAKPFHDALDRDRPDLSGLHYAMFGLGDSAYPDTYSRGSEIIDRTLTECGARRVGAYGRHDASSLAVASDLAIAWTETLLRNGGPNAPIQESRDLITMFP